MKKLEAAAAAKILEIVIDENNENNSLHRALEDMQNNRKYKNYDAFVRDLTKELINFGIRMRKEYGEGKGGDQL